jgi:hypothetical protein
MAQVFISHSHRDSRLAAELAGLLESNGLSTWSYGRDSIFAHSYLQQVYDAITQCEMFAVLISRSSIESEQVNKEVIRAYESGRTILPLLIDVTFEDLSQIRPNWRQALGDTNALTIPREGLPAIRQRIVDGIQGLSRPSRDAGRPGRPAEEPGPESHAARPPQWIHVLSPAKDFVGRERELETVRRFWESGEPGVLALVGIGGTGKTSIVEHFLRTALRPDQRLPASFLGWSFYESINSGDLIDACCEYLGVPVTERLGEQNRLRRLKNSLASGDRHVMVLDGMERIQQERPRFETQRRAFGEIVDPNMRDLLRSAAAGLGRCKIIVTSRFPLADLEGWIGRGYTKIELDVLSEDDAVALLRKHGVKGHDRVLRALINRYGRHALTLTHLGGLLSRFFGGDPAQAPSLGPLENRGQDAVARRFDRVLSSYREYLPTRELAVMQCLSVFRQGVDHDDLTGLVQRMFEDLTQRDVDDAIEALALYHLITRDGPRRYNLHPYIRDYFFRSFDAATQAHASMASTLQSLDQRPGKGFQPPGLGLDRLEQLIDHVCSAGNPADALEIFMGRMGGGFHLAQSGEFARGLRIIEMLAERLGKDPFTIDPDGCFALRRGTGELLDDSLIPSLSMISSDQKVSCRLLRGHLTKVDSVICDILRGKRASPWISRDFAPRFSGLLLADRTLQDDCWSDSHVQDFVNAQGKIVSEHQFKQLHREFACHSPPWADRFLSISQTLQQLSRRVLESAEKQSQQWPAGIPRVAFLRMRPPTRLFSPNEEQGDSNSWRSTVMRLEDLKYFCTWRAEFKALHEALNADPAAEDLIDPKLLDRLHGHPPKWAERDWRLRSFFDGCEVDRAIAETAAAFWFAWLENSPEVPSDTEIDSERQAFEKLQSDIDSAIEAHISVSGVRRVCSSSSSIATGPLNDAVVRLWRAETYRLKGAIGQGREPLEQAGRIIMASGSVEHMCLLQLVKGRFAIDEGLEQVAAIELLAAVDDARRAGFRIFEIDAELELGRLALRQRDYAVAIEHAERARDFAWDPECGYVWAECYAWAILAAARQGVGLPEDAERARQEHLEMRRRLPASQMFDAMMDRVQPTAHRPG